MQPPPKLQQHALLRANQCKGTNYHQPILESPVKSTSLPASLTASCGRCQGAAPQVQGSHIATMGLPPPGRRMLLAKHPWIQISTKLPTTTTK